MGKIIAWVLANGATLLGCLQAIVKAIKELLTGVVNLLSLFMTKEAAEKLVAFVRNVLNAVDGFIEKIKDLLLK
jgi:fumarate reductase subunit D